jgi:hypothetical protein
MSYYQLPSGAYYARVMINGVRHTATLPTREDAERWLAVTSTAKSPSPPCVMLAASTC